MSRSGEKRGTKPWRDRVSRGVKGAVVRRRERARVAPKDLERLRRSGTVAESLLPLLEIAADEACTLIGALGGPDVATPQQRALVEDFAALGLLLRSELARYAQAPDPELVGRVATCANARRATLSLLGLARFERELDPTQSVRVVFGGDDASDSAGAAISGPPAGNDGGAS